jgi:hypothetical protein
VGERPQLEFLSDKLARFFTELHRCEPWDDKLPRSESLYWKRVLRCFNS